MKKVVLSFIFGFALSLLGSLLMDDGNMMEFLMLTIGPLVFFSLSGLFVTSAADKPNPFNYYGAAVTSFGVGIYFCVLLSHYLQG